MLLRANNIDAGGRGKQDEKFYFFRRGPINLQLIVAPVCLGAIFITGVAKFVPDFLKSLEFTLLIVVIFDFLHHNTLSH